MNNMHLAYVSKISLIKKCLQKNVCIWSSSSFSPYPSSSPFSSSPSPLLPLSLPPPPPLPSKLPMTPLLWSCISFFMYCVLYKFLHVFFVVELNLGTKVQIHKVAHFSLLAPTLSSIDRAVQLFYYSV